MNQIVPMELKGSQLDLIQRTVAADCNRSEFDLFIEQAKLYGLNPFKREIYAIVFSPDNPKYRKMAVVTGIDGYRVIAERSGNYRPDTQPPRYEYDEKLKSGSNPHGILSVTVSVFKFMHGEWFETSSVAYWDEYAPVKDEWVNKQKTGKKILSGKWVEMPRLMIAKVAEALALRKAFPNAVGGLYTKDEMEYAQTIDATATEELQEYKKQERVKIAGVGNSIPFQPLEGGYEMIPIDKFADKCLEAIGSLKTLKDLQSWKQANSGDGRGLRVFWAENASDALELKSKIEQREKELMT